LVVAIRKWAADEAFLVSAFLRVELYWRINARLAVSNGGTWAEGPRGLGTDDPLCRLDRGWPRLLYNPVVNIFEQKIPRLFHA
jgi:hypothetical protein